MRYRPRRELIGQAIRLASESEKGRGVITLNAEDPVNSISVDAALLIIKKVEYYRELYRNHKVDLRGLVAYVVYTTGYDSGRRRAYHLAIMRYYNLIWQYVSRIRRLRKMPREIRPLRKPRPVPPLALVG